MYKNAVIPAMEPESRSFNRKGFTLIELLVVVLIIGILSAVALPQYQKAVLKSRMAVLLPIVKSIQQAEEIYWLENGHYTENFHDLDIKAPGGVGGNTSISGWNHHQCALYHAQFGWVWCITYKEHYYENNCGWAVWLDHSSRPGEITCTEMSNTVSAECKAVCASLGYTYRKI